jgi:hypothetical protein
MANKFDANPLQFTTSDASLKNAQTPKYLPTSNNGLFIVKKIVWVGPGTAGDTYTVTDGNGNTISTGSCVTGSIGLPQTNMVDQLVGDVQVTQLSSGTLLIYICAEGE